jgi:hypothetical protein
MVSMYLDQAIRSAGIPITGVSVGRVEDRSTWRVAFEARATEAQRTQAQQIVETFTLPTPDQLQTDAAARDIDVTALKAVVIEIYPYLSSSKPSLAQLRQNIIARYKALNGG